MSPQVKILPIGELPSLGVIPEKMYAQVLRSNRLGDPLHAFQIEEINIPSLKNDEVLIAVMAAGVNYNNVWAAMGSPIDVIRYRNKKGSREDFHIGGSDASGIVYKIGSNVMSVKIGDEVVIHAGYWDKQDPWIVGGGDPILSDTCQAWGYETNYGSFSQFAVAKDHQCLPKPNHLTWEEAATYMLSGATAYRMLTHWVPNNLKFGEAVLIWGGSGGIGAMAIQITKHFGGVPVAIVSDETKMNFCKQLGAVGVINRNNFKHWGSLSDDIKKTKEEWNKEIRRFSSKVLEFTAGIPPSIVIEHPGEKTLPTSLYICKKGGMAVTCGGTSGYIGSFDLRHLWVHQKTIQGSHFASTEECLELNELVMNKRISPILSRSFSFQETGYCHSLMKNNLHSPGSMAIRIGCTR